MKLPKDYVSYSQLYSFNQCAKCWYLQYILGVQFPEPEYFRFGKAVHTAIEHYHKGTYVEDVETRDYVKVYSEQYTPEYTAVEEFFRIPIIHPIKKTRMPILLSGKIDLIRDEWVIDHKTASRPWPQGKEDDDVQGTIYSYAYRVMFKKQEKGIRFNVLQKLKKPKLDIRDTFRTAADMVQLYDYIEETIAKIHALNEVPEHDYRCFNRNLFP